MKKNIKRVLTLLLAASVILSSVSVSAFAEETDENTESSVIEEVPVETESESSETESEEAKYDAVEENSEGGDDGESSTPQEPEATTYSIADIDGFCLISGGSIYKDNVNYISAWLEDTYTLQVSAYKGTELISIDSLSDNGRISFAWAYNGEFLADNASSLEFTVKALNNCKYTCSVTTDAGTSEAVTANISVVFQPKYEIILEGGTSVSADKGDTVTFTGSAYYMNGTEKTVLTSEQLSALGVTYKWTKDTYKDGAYVSDEISGADSITYNLTVDSFSVGEETPSPKYTLHLSCGTQSSETSFTVTSKASNEYTLVDSDKVSTVTCNLGKTVSLSSSVYYTKENGERVYITDLELSEYGISLQWYKGSTKLDGETGSTYTISKPLQSDLGTYTLKLYTNGVQTASKIFKLMAYPVLEFDSDTVTKTFVKNETFTNELTTKITDGNITYTSDKTTVAKVNRSTGEVTILKPGKATITARAAQGTNFKGGTITYTLVINNTLTVEKTSYTVVNGSSAFTIKASSAAGSITYGSSNAYVASVNKTSGLVTIVKPGIVTITVTAKPGSGDNFATVTKTVKIKVIPATPTISSWANTNDGVKISWNTVKGATGYKVFRLVNNSYALVKTVTDNYYVDTATKNSANGKIFKYKVVAYTTNSTGTVSSSSSAVKSTSRVKSLPVISTTSKGSVRITLKTTKKKITVSFSKPSNCAYQVYRSTSGNGKYTLLKTVYSGSSWTDTTVKSGTTYYYKVRAYKTVNGVKIYSAWTEIHSITAK